MKTVKELNVILGQQIAEGINVVGYGMLTSCGIHILVNVIMAVIA